jgi:phosphoribosylaminoimidazole-succinocarboxamide synthase
VRDYLEAIVQRGEWNREPPPPDLTPEVVQTTSARYKNLFERLTGSTLEQNREGTL